MQFPGIEGDKDVKEEGHGSEIDSALIRASDGGDNDGCCCKRRKTIHYYYDSQEE